MPAREGQNDLPYHSPVTSSQAPVKTTRDEGDERTIVSMFNIIDEATTGLYKEFNAFTVLSDGTDEEVRDKMMRQIAGNQIAYDILSPVLERLRGVLAEVDENFKRRQQ